MICLIKSAAAYDAWNALLSGKPYHTESQNCTRSLTRYCNVSYINNNQALESGIGIFKHLAKSCNFYTGQTTNQGCCTYHDCAVLSTVLSGIYSEQMAAASHLVSELVSTVGPNGQYTALHLRCGSSPIPVAGHITNLIQVALFRLPFYHCYGHSTSNTTARFTTSLPSHIPLVLGHFGRY